MGKVLFSQVSICLHPRGYPILSSPGGTLSDLYLTVSHSAITQGGTPSSLHPRGYPIQPSRGTLSRLHSRGVPDPAFTWEVTPIHPNGLPPYPIELDGGTHKPLIRLNKVILSSVRHSSTGSTYYTPGSYNTSCIHTGELSYFC